MVTDKEGLVATLQWLYIDNHPDRVGFYGSTAQLAQWALRMGLLTSAEAEALA